MRRTLGPAGLFVLLAVALFGTAAEGQGAGAQAKPNLLLITLDTTRADHVGCYGMKGARTPVLDGLASRGALFEQAHSAVPLTLPSHCVIMTGLLSSELNLRVNGLKLNQDVPTLATILKARGYWTGAAVSSVILEKERGLSRGFAEYDDRMTLSPRSGGSPEERSGMEVADTALALVKKSTGPYFLWVHYYDPHYEYRPPEPYATAFSKNLYDGEIAYMDAAIGNLLEGLKAAGKLENTLIVAVGDHGEGLMEHGERQHGVFLYEYALRVPLMVVFDGRVKPGLKIPSLCGLEDLAPTILDLMGVPPPKVNGVSLRPLMEGKTLPERSFYIESYHGYFTYGWAPLRGIMTEKWKFIEAPKAELYDWRASEDKNLFAPDRLEVKAARKELTRYTPADADEMAQMENFLKDPSNAETLKKLQSLGYLSGGGTRPDTPGLLDPKDAIGIEEDMLKAKEAGDMGQVKEARDILLGVVKRNPQNVPALSMLGLLYLGSGDLEKAQACFTEEVRLKPQMETGHLNLGTVYKRTGKADLAEKEYRAALALSPRMPEAASNLGQLLLNQKRTGEARSVLDAALAAGAVSADLYFELGVLEASASNWEKARFDFTKTVSLDPRRDEAFANLGKIAYAQGRVDEAIFQFERASRVAPGKATYLATLGSLYLNGKNDAPKGLQYFQRAIAAEPYSPDAKNLKELVRQLQAEGVK